MVQRLENRSIDDAVELLKENGFDGLAEAVTVLLNSAMVSERSGYLCAAPYKRSAHRVGRVRSKARRHTTFHTIRKARNISNIASYRANS